MVKKIAIGIIIFTVIALFFISIPDYGMNWDEPTHYIRGQVFLHYFLTGKTDYNDLPKLRSHYPKIHSASLPQDIKYEDDKNFRRSIYQFDGGKEYLSFSYFNNGEGGIGGHPPLNGILASLSNYIFYQKLGIVGDIEGYHIFTVFISMVLAIAVFLFAAAEFGLLTGIISFLSLVLFPLFFSESHFNVKDPVETSFYALTLIGFYYSVTKNSLKWMIVSSLFAGMALGTKLNIVFSSINILIWLFVLKWNVIKKLRWPFSGRITVYLIFLPIISSMMVYVTWPYLWQNPRNILSIFSYYKDIGLTSYQPSNYFIFGIINTYAIQWILFTTPLVIWFFSIFGIFYCFESFFKEKNKTSFFVLLWFLIPILRVSIFNAGIYGGVRQIMEFIPAMAILSGVGAKYIAELLNYYIVKKIRWNIITIKQLNNLTIKPLFLLQVIIIAFFIPITLKLISIHPNENVYFNPLIGGLKGAKEKNFPDWGVTLGSPYMQGMAWLNDNAEYNARVALVKGLLTNVPRIKIRSDIYFSESYYSGKKKDGEYLMEVMDYGWKFDVPEEKRKYIETLVPIYEKKVDGVTILGIWKNDKSRVLKNRDFSNF